MNNCRLYWKLFSAMVTPELFGSFAKYIPLIGESISRVLQKLSLWIESRSNTLGFMRFIILRKIA